MEPDDIAAELKEDNQMISSWLIYYRERKRNVEDIREEILYRTQQPGADRVSSSTISDPAYQRAEELQRKTEQDMKWLKTVEDVYSILGAKKRLLLQLRQDEVEKPITKKKRGRPGWVIWVQMHWEEEYLKSSVLPIDCCWVTDDTLKDWWAEIINIAARLAGKRGLLNGEK